MKLILLTPTSDGTNSTYMRSTKKWYRWFAVSWDIIKRNGFKPLLVMYKDKAYLARLFNDGEKNVYAKNSLVEFGECAVLDPDTWFKK